MSGIEQRKEDHIRINLDHDVAASTNPWDEYRLRHNALPEMDREDVDLGVRLMDRELKAPFVITGMTGGAEKAGKINQNLARAAAKHGVAMGVGSQRAALKDPALAETYRVVADHDVPLRIANLGLPQLIQWGPEESVEAARQCVEMVHGHALAVHLNFLQECVQPEGDTDATGGIAALEALAKVFRVPIMVKETGAGIGGAQASIIERAGIRTIDVGGAGGTSFSAVEAYRAEEAGDEVHHRMGRTFWDWGIPTPQAVQECVAAVDDRTEVVATGGIRNGLDAAKALAMGATAVGVGGVMFRAAAESAEAADRAMALLIEELKTALFLTGSAGPDQLWRSKALS